MPLNSLKGEINSTFTEVASTFGAAQLPLPVVRTIQFCNNVNTSFVDDIGGPLVHIAQTSAFILIGLVVVLALVNSLVEWYRFCKVQETIDEIRRTPWLLEQLRFPLSNSPTRTFSHSIFISSRPSARAQLAGFHLAA